MCVSKFRSLGLQSWNRQTDTWMLPNYYLFQGNYIKHWDQLQIQSDGHSIDVLSMKCSIQMIQTSSKCLNARNLFSVNQFSGNISPWLDTASKLIEWEFCKDFLCRRRVVIHPPRYGSFGANTFIGIRNSQVIKTQSFIWISSRFTYYASWDSPMVQQKINWCMANEFPIHLKVDFSQQ